jgi:hypothetical protein
MMKIKQQAPYPSGRVQRVRALAGGALVAAVLLAGLAPPLMAAGGSASDGQTDAEDRGFYSGAWTQVDVDKQWVINGLPARSLIRIECEGDASDQQAPAFLLVTEAGEYRWPVNESGGAFVELETLALREAGSGGAVVTCRWSRVDGDSRPGRALQLDVLPGQNILLGGFEQARAFSVRFDDTAGCRDLTAPLFIDGSPLVTMDNQPQLLTPNASYFGTGRTVEAKFNGLCGADEIPTLLFSIAR